MGKFFLEKRGEPNEAAVSADESSQAAPSPDREAGAPQASANSKMSSFVGSGSVLSAVILPNLSSISQNEKVEDYSADLNSAARDSAGRASSALNGSDSGASLTSVATNGSIAKGPEAQKPTSLDHEADLSEVTLIGTSDLVSRERDFHRAAHETINTVLEIVPYIGAHAIKPGQLEESLNLARSALCCGETFVARTLLELAHNSLAVGRLAGDVPLRDSVNLALASETLTNFLESFGRFAEALDTRKGLVAA